MSELEIKELQDIQKEITEFERQYKLLESNRNVLYGINNTHKSTRCEVTFYLNSVTCYNIPGLSEQIFTLIENYLTNHLAKVRKKRDDLIICVKSNSYKPIDILDKV